MNREKMRKQAQNLRNKRSMRRARQVSLTKGTAHVSQPVAPKTKEVDVSPPTAAQARRRRSARIIEQRKQIRVQRMNTTNAQSQKSGSQSAKKSSTRKGCGGCRRKGRG